MPWSVKLDKPVIREQLNAVAYVTYTHSDGVRNVANKRVPYDNEIALLKFLAKECIRLDQMDERFAAMDEVVAAATITPGPLVLPDIAGAIKKEEDTNALNTKIFTALSQKHYDEAVVIDPTIAIDKAKLESGAEAVVVP